MKTQKSLWSKYEGDYVFTTLSCEDMEQYADKEKYRYIIRNYKAVYLVDGKHKLTEQYSIYDRKTESEYGFFTKPFRDFSKLNGLKTVVNRLNKLR